MMSTLLHLDASARTRSFSRRLSARFASSWRTAHPSGRYLYRDLAAEPVPHVTEAWTELCDAVLGAGITDIGRYREVVRTPAQRAAWAVLAPLLDELVAADTVLIGTPMYNFSVPAALKAWIDQVTFPRMSLRGKRFVVAGARGGTYLPGTPRAPFDHEERYLRDFFAGHFDVPDVEFVHAELTNALVDPRLASRRDEQEASLAAALARMDEVAT
ncbi:FMN-dependent NADH-azoreductase [Actinophytocola algeriensis]|uniref:FMN dependent NADH:quinone oxidoreductase n=2 Tax=Actinophytocola algeriensis TaxID=1768010 RepID=A0A7W7VBD3_9PSEU|nr:FMN-dependent NADH-azoreductase [Actinophytocola algeriensis]MBE1477228.1 FMN-dependent NADH-azoreductase [Actinophytocola algeriensis]